MESKKGQSGQLNVLISVGVLLTVAIIIWSFSALIMGDVKTDAAESYCAGLTSGDYGGNTTYNATSYECGNSTNGGVHPVGSDEFNITSDGLVGMTNVTTKFPTLGTIVVAIIIIGLLVTGFYVYSKR